ncbi:hypothetical protein [Isoptericola cucumis]|uniref:LPXTG-motif cell wall anchor domain protein n=1 Tax=Isoptericola cucumis TaxID=1776856 RepID=A0ABQ2B7P5_9MICO|nr:hypothetical protein [Isoptericola cucumis]GGI09614.1 hypothetical protein GCM10007368_27060 [Isoptericola cucumis]
MTLPEPHTESPAPQQGRRTVVHRAVAVVVALAMALAVSLVLVPDSEGAPKFNVRCDELVDGIEGVADLADLPGGGLPDAYDEKIDDYEYKNPAEQFRDRKAPTQAELDALKGSYEDFDPGTEDHLLRRWKAYDGEWGWERWRNTYIPAISNDSRGDGFHKNVAKRLKLGGADWMCEDNKLWKEKNLGYERRYDSVNRQHKIAYELKSGNSQLNMDQLRADRALRAQGWRVVYIFSKEPKPGQLRLLQQYGIEHTKLHSSAVPRNPQKSPSNAMNPPCKPGAQPSTLSTSAAACPRRSTAGPAKQLATESGRNAADAREAQRIRNDLSRDLRRPGFGAQRPGGIDWRSLELKYVSDDPKNDDYSYAFSADELPDDGEAEPGFGGEAALDLSSDALFTWLALDSSQFWVNLNPDTPETIVDKEFGTTDAGRVLLEADLEMKKSLTDLSNPETELGKKHWDSLERTEDGVICYDWTRLWIEPQPAKVRTDGDQLYILDAPLQVQIEPFEIDWTVPGEEPCTETAPKDMVERNTQRIVDDFEQPLEDYVNTAPEFADLRRVYTARVAAEWIKDRDAKRPGAFHDVIGSGDVSAWPARTDYDPQDVFDELMDVLQTVQYRYEYEHGSAEYYVEVMGGIELPDAPRDQTPKAEFERDHPKLPRTVQRARHDTGRVPVEAQPQDAVGTLAEGAETVAWLGGGTPLQAEEPGPDPTDPPGDGDGGGGGPGDGNGGGNGGGPGGNDGGPGGGAGDDDAGGGGRDSLPSRADGPSRAEAPPSDVVPSSGPMPATGFGDAWLVPAALVLVLAGLALVLVRRRWTGGR